MTFPHLPFCQQASSVRLPTFILRLLFQFGFDSSFAYNFAYKAAASNPDTLLFDQAMSEPEHHEKWQQATKEEIAALESKNTWVEVWKSEAKGKILPGTWVFCRKRMPDGSIQKFKARWCIRGDLQEGTFDTYAPVVAWSSI
jgi:hypothetical protein